MPIPQCPRNAVNETSHMKLLSCAILGKMHIGASCISTCVSVYRPLGDYRKKEEIPPNESGRHVGEIP